MRLLSPLRPSVRHDEGFDWFHWSQPSIPPAQQACCCPAHACYQAVLPPGPARNRPVEIYLCAHHLHESRVALDHAGAAVYDADGTLVLADLELPTRS